MSFSFNLKAKFLKELSIFLFTVVIHYHTNCCWPYSVGNEITTGKKKKKSRNVVYT